MTITLKRLTATSKAVREVYAMLRHQPPAHYQAWGYGEPDEKSVRKLLSCNSVFAILLEPNLQLVGIIGFGYKGRYFIPLYNGQFWIHYLIDKTHTGRGIATIALQKLLKILREETDIKRIYAGINTDNPASIRVVQKFGFVKREERARTQVFEKVLSQSQE